MKPHRNIVLKPPFSYLVISILLFMVQSISAQSLLPNPLIWDEGGANEPITTTGQWDKKREWIKEQYQHWVSGTVPPAPDSPTFQILSEREEGNVLLRTVEVRFGTHPNARLTLEIMIPQGVTGKLPVFMTQWNHRGWAQVAVRRGYMACIYAGADAKDDTEDYAEVYPDYDFATLMRRAWGASRAVDYLYTLPEVDTDCIAITGHSRNGKQSLMAAAFDERIKAVVSSSGGTGGESVFRFTDERFDTESIEEITRNFPHWFHPRLRSFSGREDKLPVDQNLLMSLIAPRGLMLSSAITEHQGNPWAIEQAYKSVKTVYSFLDKPDQIAINLRNGKHGTSARDIEDFLDFFDYTFGRSDEAPENRLYYDYSFDRWQQTVGAARLEELRDYPDSLQTVQDTLRWLLGEEPAGFSAGTALSWADRKRNDDFMGDVIGQPALLKDSKQSMIIGPYDALGDYLWGQLYLPPGTDLESDTLERLPLAIYLHEYAYATGFRRRSSTFIDSLTHRGFAVLTFDMVGYGSRIEEFRRFYHRYPKWSVMGRMVADVRQLVTDATKRMDFIDEDNVFLTGYSLGGTVSLLAAALDSRIKGAAVASAFSPLRDKGSDTEGLTHYYDLHGLIPKLGFFAGNEEEVPLDFDGILGCIAPRPLLIVAPLEDRHHRIERVRPLLEKSKSDYEKTGRGDCFSFETPEGPNQFTPETRQVIADWLESQLSAQSKKSYQ